jgi:predicted fused transcriptional regulator/phosphomethylpyrimidine kinase
VKVSDIEYRFNERFVNLDIGPTNETYVSETIFKVYQSITQVKVIINVKFVKSEEVFVDRMINLCSFERERRSNIFIKLLFSKFVEKSTKREPISSSS